MAGTGVTPVTLAWWLVACAGVDDFSAEAVHVDTLAGGRIVVTSPDVPNLTALPHLVEELRIGSLNGVCDAFGDALSVAVDAAGRIYVADRQANEIRVFDAQGDCVRTFGREGEGPGEFRMLAGVVSHPSGLLWAMDAISYRLTAFDSAGSVWATHSLRPSMSASFPWRLTVDADGALYWPNPAEHHIVKFGVGRQPVPLDTARVPQLEAELVTDTKDTNEYLTVLFPVPESPSIQWAVDREGHLWLANTLVFELHETTFDGDTVRTVRLDRSPSELKGQERDSIASAHGIAASSLPRFKTLFGGFTVDADGWIWVMRDATPRHVWDVFDEMGRYLGPIESPVPVKYPIFGAGTVTAVAEDELGVQYVVRLRAVY